MTKQTIKGYMLIAGALATLAGAAFARADTIDYPAKSVRLFVPAAPGGATDALARAYAREFETVTGKSMAIVNQPGGGGVVAFQSMITSRADGATLLFYHSALHVAKASGRSPFGLGDMRALGTLGEMNEVYAVRTDAPYTSIPELVDYANGGGKVTVAMQLGGSTQVKAQALANLADGIRAIDAGTEGQRVTSLLGKQVDVGILGLSNARQYEKNGDIRIIGVINDKPDAFEPEWPTTAAQGVDIVMPVVFALYGQKKLPDALVSSLDSINELIQASDSFKADMQRYGIAPAYRPSTQANEYLAEEEQDVRKLL